MQKIILYIELIIFIIATIYTAVIPKSQIVITEEVVEEQPTQLRLAYNENQDLVAVEYAFVDKGGCGRIRVKNNSQNQLISYTLNISYYNENKELIDEKQLEISDVKISSGFVGGMDKHIPMPDNKNQCKYISARVINAQFTTAPQWVNENISLQAEPVLLTMDEIPVEKVEYKCKFLEITNISPAKEDVNSERKNLIFYIKNIGDKPVKNINFILAQYDAEGKSVAVAPYVYIGENIRQLYWNNVNLAVGQGKKAVSQLVLEPECVGAEIIVEKVEFENGLVWLNQGSLQWILNKNTEDN